ncbi:MAG: Cob(I)yrinic acid a,c-diamide adenosyltransferase, partial [Bacteroidota bacterium]
MAIYTKTGDKGLTRLADGAVMSKAETRIVAMGDLDELNSHLGLFTSRIDDKKLIQFIQNCQSTIFTIGAHIASNDTKSLGNMKM